MKKHHFLVTGQVIFTEGDQPLGSINLNVVINGKDKDWNIQRIARAQQAIQMKFLEMIAEPTIQVRNIVLMNIMHLAFCTEHEFNKLPANTAVQERIDTTESDAILNAAANSEEPANDTAS